jgi:hypothetical protein
MLFIQIQILISVYILLFVCYHVIVAISNIQVRVRPEI